MNTKRDNGSISSDMLKPNGSISSKTCTKTIHQLLSKLDDVVEKTLFIGNRPFALSSGKHLYEVIDGPMLYAIFTRHVTKSLALDLAKQIESSNLCSNLIVSPTKSSADVASSSTAETATTTCFRESPVVKSLKEKFDKTADSPKKRLAMEIFNDGVCRSFRKGSIESVKTNVAEKELLCLY